MISSELIDKMREGLQQAKAARTQLDNLDDSVSSVIKKVEAALAQLSLGFVISFAQEVGNGAWEGLEYRKWNGKWRLVYYTGFPDQGDEDYTLLLDCDRDTRAQMLREALPQLILNVGKALSDRIGERQAAIEVGQQINQLVSVAGHVTVGDDIPF